MKNHPPVSPLGQLLRGRRALALAAGLVIGVACYGLWKEMAGALHPRLARARVQHYLRQQTHAPDFKVEFAFPSAAEVTKAPAASISASATSAAEAQTFEALRTQYLSLKTTVLASERAAQRWEAESKQCAADLETLAQRLAEPGATNAAAWRADMVRLRADLSGLQARAASARADCQARAETLAPVARELQRLQERWRAQAEADGSASARRVARAAALFAADLRPEFALAGSYEKMCRLIGQELWVASRLLESANPGHQRVGVTLALDACRHALEDVQNGWVAARICEGYVWPHLGLANDANRDSPFHPDSLLSECAEIFRQNLEVRNVVRVWERVLVRPGTTQRADWARSQVAMACQEAGDLRLALRWWRQIQNTNDYRWIWQNLSALEKQLTQK